MRTWLLRHVVWIAAVGCSSAPDPTGLPEPLAKHAPVKKEDGPVTVAPAPVVPTEIDSCEALAASAAVHPADAAILLGMCPEVAPGPGVLRHALTMAGSPAAALALLPRLKEVPDLAGLAKLAAVQGSSGPVPAALPDPATATVSPITEEVLAAVHLALVQQTGSGVTHDQRTRSTAYLARVHHEALLQLGSGGDEPLSPFARVIAGRFVHWGRELCRMYWQRRVAGLEGLFASTEAQLMRTVAALERTPHAGDDGLLAVERQRARRHLQGAGVKERVTKAGAPSPTTLLPLPHEFDRLLDQGFVELAIQRALFLGGEVGGFGVATMADMLRGELTRRDLGAYTATLERRIAEARALVPAPPELGKPLPGRVALTWPGDQVTADAAQGWLTAAASASGFARRHALARAVLLLEDRPDAARVLLARLLAASPRDPAMVGLVLDLLRLQEEESLASLRLQVDADAGGDAGYRRMFARASREAGLVPR